MRLGAVMDRSTAGEQLLHRLRQCLIGAYMLANIVSPPLAGTRAYRGSTPSAAPGHRRHPSASPHRRPASDLSSALITRISGWPTLDLGETGGGPGKVQAST